MRASHSGKHRRPGTPLNVRTERAESGPTRGRIRTEPARLGSPELTRIAAKKDHGGRRDEGSRTSLRAAILLAAILAANADGHERVVLPAATHADLASGRADATLRAAFLGADAPGAMLVRGIPGYETARIDALETLASCARSMDAAAISDGVLAGNARWDRAHGGNGEFTRRTLAAETSRRVPEAIDQQCGDGARLKMEALRAAADAAARAALPRLDDLLGREASRGFFADAVRADASLDHFHVYRRNGAAGVEAAGSDPAPLAPPLGRRRRFVFRVSSSAPLQPRRAATGPPREGRAHGRRRRRRDDPGAPRRPETKGDYDRRPRPSVPGPHPRRPPPDPSPDAVLVMLGEGARAWYPDGDVARAIAVPTHEMSLSSMSLGSAEGVVRADGVPSSSGTRSRLRANGDQVIVGTTGGRTWTMTVEMTFGEWRARVAAAFGKRTDDDATSAVLAAAACGDDFHEPPSAVVETSSTSSLE